MLARDTACANGATHLHMHNPKPLPPSSSSLVVVRPKVWNSLSLNSAGIPIPVSATLIDIMSVESCSTLTVIDPSCVNFLALLCGESSCECYTIQE
jgi:hypothetical protein